MRYEYYSTSKKHTACVTYTSTVCTSTFCVLVYIVLYLLCEEKKKEDF